MKTNFDTLYNDPNAANIDYNEKHFSSHSNTRDNEEILNMDGNEIEEAIKKAKHRKAPGVNDITVEELEVDIIGSGADVLLSLFGETWEHKVIPIEWKHSVIISIHEKKDKLGCSSYRGINLLCHSSEIFSSIMLQRIKGKQRKS